MYHCHLFDVYASLELGMELCISVDVVCKMNYAMNSNKLALNVSSHNQNRISSDIGLKFS